jgi:hypothetical protein
VKSWKRILLVVAALAAVGGALSVYIGYRVMFRKNPEVVREIRASEQRQQDIEAAFAQPARPAN